MMTYSVDIKLYVFKHSYLIFAKQYEKLFSYKNNKIFSDLMKGTSVYFNASVLRHCVQYSHH